MYHGVIGCQPGRAGAGEPPVASDLVGELAGIGAGGGIRDQPALQIASAGPDRGECADHAVQSQPVQALPNGHAARVEATVANYLDHSPRAAPQRMVVEPRRQAADTVRWRR